MNDEVLSLSNIKQTFTQGKNQLKILNGCDLTLNQGEVVGLIGPSGSGKSTLLHIAGLLEKPDSGTVTICGELCDNMDDDNRTRVRRQNLGFVYQHHHLLPEFSALENISIPQIIAGKSKRVSQTRATELLEWLGLSERLSHRPARLSGGEQQRVAIGRALSNSPKLLLADEPTGNLDPHTSDEVFDILMRLARGIGLTALVATHNLQLASRMDRKITLDGGCFVES
ncbi:MAG: ABC transporter [Magnetovibrio sp.]|nr:ABC transporter [Magnetovibrio sp.]|tara:strand:- start:3644 stop:4324 length:681 start_codon:yes stop_codon:yes gene_type:complete